MAIQEIKYRGISRTPSDRMTEDGGCAESLNFYNDNTENCPSLPPRKVVDEYLPDQEDYEVILIHETAYGDRYICLKGGNVGTYERGPEDDPGVRFKMFFTLDDGEKINSIKAVGKTVVLITNYATHYIRFKDGSYKDLGSAIPSPDIAFFSEECDMKDEYEYTIHAPADPYTCGKSKNNMEVQNPWQPGIISQPLRGRIVANMSVEDSSYIWQYASGYKWTDSGYKMLDKAGEKMLGEIWDAVDGLMDFNHSYGILNTPVFLSFCLRLYDGSMMAPCTPVALGLYGGDTVYDGLFKVNVDTQWMDGTADATGERVHFAMLATAQCTLDYAYKANVKFGDLMNQLSDWEDVIEGIDVYISDPVRLEQSRIKCRVDQARSGSYGTESANIDITLDPETFGSNEKLGESLVKETIFHKILSYKTNELGKISNTVERIDKDLRTDYLATCETLVPEFSTNHSITAEHAMVYNGRLVMSNITRTLTGGYDGLNGAHVPKNQTIDEKEYQYFYMISNDEGEEMLVHTDVISNRFTVGGRTYTFTPVGFLSYPDSRCYRAIVGVRKKVSGVWGNVEWKSIPMNEMPMLDAAYNFSGFFTEVQDEADAVEYRGDPFLLIQNTTEKLKGYLYQSATNNPYYFPNTGKIRIGNTEIVDIATTTKALSQGQFGSYPLYAFTKEGIWAMSQNDTGGIVTSVPLSRDVAISASMVVPIDQAIVFLTEKGMKVLSGSDIADISQFMNGKHWCIEENSSEYELISQSEWAEYLPVLLDDESFMEFMKGRTSGAYDYTGARIIFFNEDKKYQYIYKLDSQTWHKVQIPGSKNKTFRRVLNSYPQCMTSVSEFRGYSITGGVISESLLDRDKAQEILENYGFEGINMDLFLDGSITLYAYNMDEETVSRLEEELYEQYVSIEKAPVVSGGVLNWSTPLGDLTEEEKSGEIKSILVSRPFTLGQDDIHKTINEIRSRGMFEAKDDSGKARVRYILLGSQDGIRFSRLGSLRGKSWKFFRIMVLTKLRPFERFTSSVLDFVTRFTNKLR